MKLAGSDNEFPDRYKGLYFNMFFQGISTLLPWNVLIIGHNFFSYKLAKVPAAENFVAHFVLIFMTMKFLFLAFGLTITKKLQPDKLVRSSIMANTMVFSIIGITCAVEAISATSFYYLILGLVLLASLFSAFIEAGYMAMLSNFPSKYTQSYLVGHGFAGVVGTLLHITSSSFSSSADSTIFAEVYFGFSTIVILSSYLLYRLMEGFPVYRYYHERMLENMKEKSTSETSAESITLNGSVSAIFSNIYDLSITVFLITWVNVIISPMLIFMTASTQAGTATESEFHKNYFHIIAFMISSVFDLFGKVLPGFSSLAITRLPFLYLSLARLILLPLFLLGNIQMNNGQSLPLGPLYRSDALFILLISLKAFTGGYLGTLCMMWAPLRVQERDRAKAITIMVYSFGIALVIGASSALLLKVFLKSISMGT